MVLVYFAVTTFTGVTVPRSYERGRGYDTVLAEAARQDALGWRAAVTLGGGRLAVVATDREGRPVPGRVEGVLLRPLEGTEVALSFAPTGGGRWAAEAAPPQRGQWEARLTLFGPDGAAFDIRRRFVVP
jgi:nitrogen fixation protein FixH